MWSISVRSTARPGSSLTTPVSCPPPPANPPSPTSMGQRHLALSRLSDRAIGPALRLPRGLPPPTQGRAAQRSREAGLGRPHPQAHHGARAAGALLQRLPARRAPDGRDGGRGRRSVGVLSRQHRHQQSRAREISAIRLLAKVPTIAAMSYKYNVGQPFMYRATISTMWRISST